MVVPLIIGLATLGGGLWAADKTGIVDIDDSGEQVGKIVGEGIGAVAQSLPAIAESLVEGIDETITSIGKSTKGREVRLFMGLTILIITVSSYWGVKNMLRGSRSAPLPPL